MWLVIFSGVSCCVVGGLVGWRFACLGYTIERGRVTPQNGDYGLLDCWIMGLVG